MFFHYFQAGKATAPKNQKSITQFFSQKQQKSSTCGLSQLENHGEKSAKRKELSPVQSQNIDRTDEPCSTNSTNTLYTDRNGLYTPKKIKLGHSFKKLSPLKITVQKENTYSTSRSPTKYSNLKGDGIKTKESNGISENKSNWSSPLTQMSMDDVLQMDKFASKFDNNDELINVNGSLVNTRMKTPRKVLQFHDHFQNGFIEMNNSVTTQKNPDKGKTVVHVIPKKITCIILHCCL